MLNDKEHYIKPNSILSILKFSKNDELEDVTIKWFGWKCGLHHPLSKSSSWEGDIRTWFCKFHCEILPRPPQLFQRVMDLISSIWHPDGQEGLNHGKWELFYSLFPGVQGKWWNPKVYDVLASWEKFSKHTNLYLLTIQLFKILRIHIIFSWWVHYYFWGLLYEKHNKH